MENNFWDNLKTFYNKHYNIPPNIVDEIACSEILLLCVSGMSNQSIAYNLNMDLDYINVSTKEFLEFNGWKEDLDLNPYFVYNKHPDYEDFKTSVSLITPLVKLDMINQCYSLCRKYEKIREEIKNSYDDNPAS
jgi:hypothetical protein